MLFPSIIRISSTLVVVIALGALSCSSLIGLDEFKEAPGVAGNAGSAGLGGIGGSAGVGGGTGGASGGMGNAGIGGTPGEGGTGGASSAGTGGTGGAQNECAGRGDGSTCGIETAYICLEEICVESRCGDSFTDPVLEEACDDGKNGDDRDGCTDDCQYTCRANTDCDDRNACTTDACNTATHTCSNTTSFCDDGDACTADSCAPGSGCVHTFIDEDGDGYSPSTCKADGAYPNKGGDCRDEGVNASVVNPGVTAYYTTNHGLPGLTAYDYNCSNNAEQEATLLFDGACNSNFEAGWKDTLFAPGCGQTGTWYSCLTHQDVQRTQGCH